MRRVRSRAEHVNVQPAFALHLHRPLRHDGHLPRIQLSPGLHPKLHLAPGGLLHHARRGVHGVPEQAEARQALADDASGHGPGVDPHLERNLLRLIIAQDRCRLQVEDVVGNAH